MTDALTRSTFTSTPRVRLLWKILFEESLTVVTMGILQNIGPHSPQKCQSHKVKFKTKTRFQAKRT